MDETVSYDIRKMQVTDVKRVVEIEARCFNSPWSEKTFKYELQENNLARYVVLERNVSGEGSTIIGYGGFWLIYGECHITNVGVLPECRGFGVGRQLVKALLIYAKNEGASKATLEVRKTNTKAKELYQSLGFQSIGVRPNYYQDNHEDAIIMWKKTLIDL